MHARDLIRYHTAASMRPSEKQGVSDVARSHKTLATGSSVVSHHACTIDKELHKSRVRRFAQCKEVELE